jgi:tRNA threonylcarbamoyladenosine biosynthesis protein TsaB
VILAIDTCLGACSAAVLDGGRVLASRSEPMERGHQERLAPLLTEVMAGAGVGFDQLDRIGVTVGPGSFTGLRVGLAFAKGLGLALERPVVGVGTLEALAASARATGLVAAVVDARREQVYMQPFRDGLALAEPEALTAAALVAAGLTGTETDARLAPDPAVVARLAAEAAPEPPRPVYLRAPDAKLPG